MDDVDEAIKRAEHYRFEEDEKSEVFLNPISALPESKARLKRALIERIEYLIEVYGSLATFVPDEAIEYVRKNPISPKTKKIYLKMIRNVEKLKKEAIERIREYATNR